MTSTTVAIPTTDNPTGVVVERALVERHFRVLADAYSSCGVEEKMLPLPMTADTLRLLVDMSVAGGKYYILPATLSLNALTGTLLAAVYLDVSADIKHRLSDVICERIVEEPNDAVIGAAFDCPAEDYLPHADICKSVNHN